MISELIKDIAYDNIKLSQALTRAKLIANQIKNETFSKWLSKELEGYDFDDPFLPSYRKIRSSVELVMELLNGKTLNFPVIPPEDLDSKFKDLINYHFIKEPISIVEAQIDANTETTSYINLPPEFVEIVSKPYKKTTTLYKGVIRQGYRKLGKVHYQNIIELTKQKLLDTLMELENEFPNIEDKYVLSKENNDKVQNIITNNIYGSNNPMNIAVGNTVEQNGIININANPDIERLAALGVEESQVDDLASILKENSEDKSELKSKIMNWLGSVSASIAAKGLYDNIPILTNYIERLIP